LEQPEKNKEEHYLEVIRRLINCVIALTLLVILLTIVNITGLPELKADIEPKPIVKKEPASEKKTDEVWIAPDTSLIKAEASQDLIRYGKDLIANTSYYLGPKGKILQISNGMNCQNCHPDAGTKPFGNNFSAVASTYPKFRERSGSVENIYKRINDCIERSLNGKGLDTNGHEIHAMTAYIKWLGKDIPKGEKPKGAGLTELAFLDEAANAAHGKIVYDLKCKTCHGENGEGKTNTDGLSYQYPPLWGEHSYNNGAGLYRLSRFAGYVKSNMPQGATYNSSQLTDKESWDVAAFVNSQPRPSKDLSKDWPKISGKPVDHPYGPYADNFTEEQHKFGPFQPIADAKQKAKNLQK
jgi:thiosulfate dehydrogenase